MREINYKKFSLKWHQKNWQNNLLNSCQFELTFACSFHCQHCYSDCFNKSNYLKKELKTSEIFFLLEKLKKIGILWVCFTGGDPLKRKDFLKIYHYAKKLGFLITIFTNGFLLNKKILKVFKEKPPFNLEITLNAVEKNLFEKITQKKDSFKKVMNNLDSLLNLKIPLKIKTMVTQDNFFHLNKVKTFLKARNLKFYPDFIIYPRLNFDNSVCKLRVEPRKVIDFFSKKSMQCEIKISLNKNQLFPCAIGNFDNIYIDPYGNSFPCQFIRKPKFSLFKYNVLEILDKINFWIEKIQKKNSFCKECNLRDICINCPGKSFLENRDLTKPVDYFCKLAELEKYVKERN